MALWFRYAFQAVATTVGACCRCAASRLLRTQHPKFQVLRGAAAAGQQPARLRQPASYMPVAEFTAIVMIAPLVITLLAATVLKEQVSPLRWALVAGGFAGTLVIMRPGGEAFSWASLLPLGLVGHQRLVPGAHQQAGAHRRPAHHALLHRLGRHAARLAGAALRLDRAAHLVAAGPLLCLMGFMGTVGHFILILAYQRAPASTLTPYLYTQIAFAMLGGWLVFAHVPDGWSLVGIAMIAVCGAAGAWLTVRESRVAAATGEA